MRRANRQRNCYGCHVHDEIRQDKHEKGLSQHKDQPVRLLKQGQPVDREPLSRSGLSETAPDAHGPGSNRRDVPGYKFQIVDMQYS